MNAQAISNTSEEVKKLIDMADDKTIKMIYALLKVEHKEDAWTNAEFITEMDRRRWEYESGNAHLFTLEEMENNARKAYKERKNRVEYLQ